MAAKLGVKVEESYSFIVEKLRLNAEYLRSSMSTLFIEMKVLNKLMYKFRNAHRKEKFFKYLERIGKCLRRWKDLNLDSKIAKTSKSMDETESTNILDDMMLGAQLTIRGITLCQEAVQYNLAYLSLGFFVTLHITLLSLIARVWVLQKDCWITLVECYRLARSLLTHSDDHSKLNKFPSCLTSWLSKDVKQIFIPRNGADVNDLFSNVNQSDSVLQQLFKEKNGGNSAATLFTKSENCKELDLGEPVEDLRTLFVRGNEGKKQRYPTLESTRGNMVSDFKTNLMRKNVADLENDRRKAVCGNEVFERKMRLKTENRAEEIKKTQCNLKKRRTKLLLVPREKRVLHYVKNKPFVKKISCRYTLQSLLAATTNYSNISNKKVRRLLKIVSFCCHSQSYGDKKIYLKVQLLLRKELARRSDQTTKTNGHSLRNRIDKDENSFLGKFGTRKEVKLSEVSGKGFFKKSKAFECSYEKKNNQNSETEVVGENFYDSVEQGVFQMRSGQESKTVSKEGRKESSESQDNIKRDEIDDIFSVLAV